MYFEINENGKIMICAETMIKPGMTRLVPPADFIPDEMGDWIVKDGAFVYEPQTVVETPTQAERIAALEEALDLLLSGVTE